MPSLSEAITSSIISSMSPTAAMERQALESFITVQRKQAEVAASEAVLSVSAKLIDAVANEAPASVIKAYESILAKLS